MSTTSLGSVHDPAHDPTTTPASPALAPSATRTPATPSTDLLHATAPDPTDPVGPLAAPARLRVDHHRPDRPTLGSTGPTPALSWQVPTAPAGWAQVRAEIEVVRSTVGAPPAAPELVAVEGPGSLFIPRPRAPTPPPSSCAV